MRFLRISLFVLLAAAVCVLQPLKALVQAKWVSLGGDGPANPYSIQVLETGPAGVRLQIGVYGFDLEEVAGANPKSRRVIVAGMAPMEEAGAPDLPRLVRALRIPEGTSPRFQIAEQHERVFGDLTIAPSRGPIFVGEDPARKKLAKGKPYKRDQFFPAKVFDLLEPFQMRDAKGVKFAFAPFRYNPVRRELQVITRLVVDVSFETAQLRAAGGGDGAGHDERSGRRRSRSRVFERIQADAFLNGLPGAKEAAPGLQAKGPTATLAEPDGSENLLIITTSKYSTALQEFIQWKQASGINVELDTASAAGGVAAIQNKIQAKYDTEGVTYILLVGDLQDVPSPMVTLISHKASDLSYVLLEGADLVGDAIISRLPANTVKELQVQLAKIMHYGQGPFEEDFWVNHALVGASTKNPNKTSHANSIKNAMLAHPLNFAEVVRVLESDADKTITVKDAFQSLGINMFTYVGHSTETSMVSLAFSRTAAAALTDIHGAYPFVHTVACRLGDIGYANGNCFAEALLKAGTPSAPAGAMAVAAATEDMYAGHGDRGQLKAFTDYYYATADETLGSLFFRSTLYAVNCLTGSLSETLYRQWHLFGDGSLPIRKVSGESPSLSVEVPVQAAEGTGLLPGQGRVRLSKAAPAELVIGLSSSNPEIATVPVTVVAPFGASEVTFDLHLPEDELPTGAQTAEICASLPGWLSGCAGMEILDNDGVDHLTEEFLADNDLSFRSLLLVPDGSAHCYSACAQPVSGFFTNPAGGNRLLLEDDGYARVDLADGATVRLYGSSYASLFVGGNGYITFLLGDTTAVPNLPSHFLAPRISALFADLDPSAGGGVSWKQLADRLAVTFQDVPEKGTANRNSFQVELFFTGAVRMTWLEITARGGITGLSAGQGQIPPGFMESDLSAYSTCSCHLSLKVIDTLSAVDEYAGFLRSAGKVALEAPLFHDLPVALSSSHTAELAVPSSTVIPAGETEARFDVAVLNDCIADGGRLVTVTAQTEYGDLIQDAITVRDVGAVSGDLDADCDVDFDDLNYLLLVLDRPSEDYPGYDLNGDGVIDLGDVALLKFYCTCEGCVCAGTGQQTDPSPQGVEAPALGAYGMLALAWVLGALGWRSCLKRAF